MQNQNIIERTIQYGDKTISLSSGKIARQASGSVMARMGDTVVLAAVTIDQNAKEDIDFLPFMVNLSTRAYAAGKIPGGYKKREGSPREDEILVARLIDRPLRPIFPSNFFNETQVTVKLLSYDPECEYEELAIIAASAALAMSGAPITDFVAAAKVGYIDGKFILNPTRKQLAESDINICVAGTKENILMVEAEVKELPEEVVLEAIYFCHKQMQPIIDAIRDMSTHKNADQFQVKPYSAPALEGRMRELYETPLRDAYREPNKTWRRNLLNNIKNQIAEHFGQNESISATELAMHIKNIEKDVVRSMIIKDKIRIDGRTAEQIRQIDTEIGLLPRTHGSALFTRGETQALVVTTLGSEQDAQTVDGVVSEVMRFVLHYNFPSYAVGEVGRERGTSRRDIGHGNLAARALKAVIPNEQDFQYTIRVVSEITESNGSSSMASVCGGSMALMNAGVPIKTPVAGVAMGLIKEGDEFVILSDIMGDEDHLGDMDFKVAGTINGITALQMDIKISGISPEIMKQSLKQAKEGRLHILDEMAKTIDMHVSEMSKYAPKVVTITIDSSKIRELIGPGGKVIKEICAKTGAKIDIAQDGTVKVSAGQEENLNEALSIISNIVAMPEVGGVYTGKVVKIMDFGAFINYLGSNEGLVHISEIADKKIPKVSDVLSEGQVVTVKIIGIEKNGKVRLSMKGLGNDISIDNKEPVVDEEFNPKLSWLADETEENEDHIEGSSNTTEDDEASSPKNSEKENKQKRYPRPKQPQSPTTNTQDRSKKRRFL